MYSLTQLYCWEYTLDNYTLGFNLNYILDYIALHLDLTWTTFYDYTYTTLDYLGYTLDYTSDYLDLTLVHT